MSADSHWRTLTAGRSPFNSRESSAIVWTGTELVVWSGGGGRLGGASIALAD